MAAKKKYRNITVDDVKYTWSANGVMDECECHAVRVKIWADKNSVIFNEIVGEGEVHDVKPSFIAEKIKNILTKPQKNT